jgi:tRNA(fMet)-specific endonuclease VapC
VSSAVVLDTNAYSHMCTGDMDVARAVAGAGKVYLPVIVCGELHAGFLGGSQVTSNRNRLSRFVAHGTVEVLPVMPRVANVYAEIWQHLRRRGRLIPTNDIWIAAQAIEADAVLVTYDRHFLEVSHLQVWSELDSPQE